MVETLKLTLMMLISLTCSVCGGSLDRSSSKHCSAGDDVDLGCTFMEPSGTQLKDIAVKWEMEGPRGYTVYLFEGNKLEVNRVGAAVDLGGLQRGDASLHLSNVTVQDEGLYTCTVIVTPKTYQATVMLEVSVAPTVALPDEVTVTEGEEKTLRCDIDRFYPSQIEVAWFVRYSWSPEHAAVSRGVCTDNLGPNGDGIFSALSRFTVQGNASVNNGATYTCQIKHRSYPKPHSVNVMLRVQAPSLPYDITALIAGTMVTSISLVLLVVGLVFIYWKYFQKVPPSVSEIIKPAIIFAKAPTELKCNVTGYRLRNVKVRWLKLRPDPGRDTTATSSMCSETSSLNGWEDLSDRAVLHTDSMHVTSSLSVQLTILEDKTKYRCIVHYGNKDITRETVLDVKVRPSFLQITSVPHTPEMGKPLVLCCRVEKFYPKDVHVEWSRQGEPVKNVTQFGPFSDTDSEHSVWSKTELVVAKEDDKATFICRVYHDSFPEPGYEDVTYQINTQGMPPNVMFIKCDPPRPRAGEACTLSCCLSDFHPDRVSVTWQRDSQPVRGGVFSSPPVLNLNGLHSLWSFLRLTPTEQDHGAVFRCLVAHSALAEPEEREYTLSLHS
ncbi:hypothetical protein MATL_G00079460 [Megalops atlanticus]|uniref:Ig-like domain-containing protein n=1 Tax=Megalops atlanticus TaxID=7932 RepID=A0A9D3T9M0_MEGAT|nr:hypothetical protein MATL_G00079460 [Megalops atlanticus]